MNTHIRLGDYPVTPLYNIKAVVQATEISSSTLRAWERRYNMCSPQRSESGYRLYSDRDIAIIRWLKAQVDAGMSISQAVAWMDRLVNEAGAEEQALLPLNGEEISTPAAAIVTLRNRTRDFASLREDLIEALLRYDEPTAEQTLSEAFALHPIEEVSEQLIVPVLTEIGERWHRGEVSITAEHYSSNYLMQRLMSILRVSPNVSNGTTIWVGCAPGELHEIGALILSIFLRRAGYQVHYLGRNLPVDDLIAEIRKKRPSMILFSAGSKEAAAGLREMTAKIAQLDTPHPIVGYGGRIFNENPDMRSDIAGIFLGRTAQDSLELIGELLKRPTQNSNAHSRADHY